MLMAFQTSTRASRTRGQALLELLSLLSVIENKGVKVLGASDLELGDVGGGLAALDLEEAVVVWAGLIAVFLIRATGMQVSQK